MTRALRNRHRHVVFTLAFVLPAGVAVALYARPAPPLEPRGTLAPAEADASPLTGAWQARTGTATLRVAAHVGRAEGRRDAASPLALDLDVQSDVGQPELLAYWSPAAPADEVLPAGSVLLGPATLQGTRRFLLPAESPPSGGSLVLYSLAQGRVAAALPLPTAEQVRGLSGGAR